MKQWHPVLLCCIAALVILVSVTPASAEDGAYLQGPSVKSAGMAGTSLANPQDAIVAVSNPAGMSAIGPRCDLGSQVVYASTRTHTPYGSSAYSAYGGNGTMDVLAFGVLPELGCNIPLNNKLTIGFSTTLGGAGATYNESIFSNYPVKLEHLGSLFEYGSVLPTITYKVRPNIALGVSPSLGFERFEATGYINSSTGAPIDNYNAYALGYGIRAGALINVSKKVTIGGSYVSKTNYTKLKPYDKDLLAASDGKLALPDSYGAGVHVQVSKSVSAAVDYVRINWSTSPGFRKVDGWVDQNVVKAGVDYAISPKTTLRGGYSYANQYFKSNAIANNITGPLMDNLVVTIGGTRKVNAHNEFSWFYEYDYGQSTTWAKGTGPSAGWETKPHHGYFGISWGHVIGK
jgi:long-chain fatty acid transport protein